jgi:hypothetical protein
MIKTKQAHQPQRINLGSTETSGVQGNADHERETISVQYENQHVAQTLRICMAIWTKSDTACG